MEHFKRFWLDRPLLSNWLVLALGFVVLLVIFAWDVGFNARQWSVIVGATVVLAWLCAWILEWE